MFHRHFKRIPNRGYITYFRKYLAYVRKDIKLIKLTLLFMSRLKIGGKLLSVHDIDRDGGG